MKSSTPPTTTILFTGTYTHQALPSRLSSNAQSRVEGIRSRLARLRLSGGRRGITCAHGISGRLALAAQLLADEVRDDLDVQGRAVVEVGLINGGEGVLVGPVLLDAEGDGGVAAGAKVESGTAELAQLLGRGGSVALVLLSVAVGDGEAARSGVGSRSAGVVLNSTAPLQSRTGVDKGRAVYREGTVARRALNGRGSTAESASEGLDVGSGSGTLELGSSRVALSLLRVAVRYTGLDGAGVGGVRARGVLNGAAALEGRALVDKGGAVHSEGALGVGIGGDDRGRGAAKGASEGLDVGSGGGLTGRNLGDGGLDVSRGGGSVEEVLGEDAALGIVGIITSVALGGWVTNLFSGQPYPLVRMSRAGWHTLPGAKVPLLRARLGSAPMEASWTATSSSICLLPEAALEAGSWCWVRAAISAF